LADRQTIRCAYCAANPEFSGSVRARDGSEVFVYNGGLEFDETGEFVLVRGPNVVLELIDVRAMAARDYPGSEEAVAGHGVVHVELRPADALRLAALLLAHNESHNLGF
jgi:hypothetical protein